MLNNYIVELINTFDTKEVEGFKVFLDSPYFNKGFNANNLKVLFAIIAKAKEDSTLEIVERTDVYDTIFPDSPVIEGKLDKLFSELKKLLLEFLGIQRYQSSQNESNRGLDLLVELRLRGLETRYFQALEKMKKRIPEEQGETLENYKLQLDIAFEEYQWELTYNKVKGDLNIPAVIKHLDGYYNNERIWLLNILLFQQKAVILPTPHTFDTKEFSILQMENNVLFQISWKIFQLLNAAEPSIEQFQELLQMLKTNEKNIGTEYLAGFYTHLRNFGSLLIERGHYDLRIVQHQIHVDNLALGYFYYEGKIASNAFLNITQTALNVHHVDWANDFVESHRDRILGENETHDFYRMNKAICLFAEQKFEEALDFIPFGSTYSFYHLMARRLELKIYYELDSDLLFYKIDAFKMFLSRAGNKVLSANLYDLHLNFINFLRQLSVSPKIRDSNRSEKMMQRINQKKLVADRAWLLEKTRDIGKRK